MCEYPRERKGQRQIWANRVVRLIQKSCAANEIGIEACWLVTCVALVEDSKHYSGPVTFWTGQLLPITGFQSWGRLNRARERACAAGWLHYRAGTRRQCGVYWSLIPPSVATAFSDKPIDEENYWIEDQQNDDSSNEGHRNSDGHGDSNVTKQRFKRDKTVNLLPVPVPIPEEEQGHATPSSAASKKPRKANAPKTPRPSYSPEFDAIWNAYPPIRRKHKKQTHDEYQAAVRRLAEADSGDLPKAASWLLQRVEEFAGSYYGANHAPESQRWFRDDRFHDAAESWKKFGQRNQSDSSEFRTVRDIIKQIWSPDIKNYLEIQAAIGNPELFAAAKQTGLSLLADSSERDRKIELTFSTNLEIDTLYSKGYKMKQASILRLPPQNLDAERGVLGSIVLMPSCIDEISTLLVADDFYCDAHQKFYGVIVDMYRRGCRGIDAVTVSEELIRRSIFEDVGGAGGIAQILEAVPHAAHVRYYASIVREKARIRNVIHLCSRTLQHAYEATDADELISELDSQTMRLSRRRLNW